MRRLLVINPNTSASVSSLLEQHVQQVAGATVQVSTVTARFGAPYISCEASYAVAGHALLDAWAAHQAEHADKPPHAVLIACFGDPGLWALRESSASPVTGLAEASFIEAGKLGPFAVVTGGAAWGPMLRRLASCLGYAGLLRGIHTVAPSGAQLAADHENALKLLTEACQQAGALPGVCSVILGGAGLAGMAAAVQSKVHVPVIDSVAAGARHALSLDPMQARRDGFEVHWQQVSPALSALGLR
jgi:allantoin racemase